MSKLTFAPIPAFRTLKAFVLSAACLAVAACEVATVDTNRKVMDVYWDDGGIIENYAAHIEWLNQNDIEVRIHGYCASACTMYLGADHVRLSPDADVDFHSALPLPGDTLTRREYDEWMTSYYPPELRDWFYTKAFRLQLFTVRLKGHEVIAMGVPSL